jgi:hypothetical protein
LFLNTGPGQKRRKKFGQWIGAAGFRSSAGIFEDIVVVIQMPGCLKMCCCRLKKPKRTAAQMPCRSVQTGLLALAFHKINNLLKHYRPGEIPGRQCISFRNSIFTFRKIKKGGLRLPHPPLFLVNSYLIPATLSTTHGCRI